MEENILTNIQVYRSGLYKLSIIAANMLDGYTRIEEDAFRNCRKLTSIEIPDSITSIGDYAFMDCTGLTSVTIPNSVITIGEGAFFGCANITSLTIGDKIYKLQTVIDGKCKAYKGFNIDMMCRNFQYKKGEIYELNDEPILCKRGFHAYLSFTDIFNYHFGEFGKDLVIHEVELEGVSNKPSYDSKIVAKKITIGERIL